MRLYGFAVMLSEDGLYSGCTLHGSRHMPGLPMLILRGYRGTV